jgi:hypothetical protein
VIWGSTYLKCKKCRQQMLGINDYEVRTHHDECKTPAMIKREANLALLEAKDEA